MVFGQTYKRGRLNAALVSAVVCWAFTFACGNCSAEKKNGGLNENDVTSGGDEDSLKDSGQEDSGEEDVCRLNSDCDEGYICNDDMKCQKYEKPEQNDDDAVSDDDDDNSDEIDPVAYAMATECIMEGCPSSKWWREYKGKVTDDPFDGMKSVEHIYDKVKNCNEYFKGELLPDEIGVDLSKNKKSGATLTKDNRLLWLTYNRDVWKCFPPEKGADQCNGLAVMEYNLNTKLMRLVWNWGGLSNTKRGVDGDYIFEELGYNSKSTSCQYPGPVIKVDATKPEEMPPIYDIYCGYGDWNVISGDGIVAVRGYKYLEQEQKIFIYDADKPEEDFQPIYNFKDYEYLKLTPYLRQIHDGWVFFGQPRDMFMVNYKDPTKFRSVEQEYVDYYLKPNNLPIPDNLISPNRYWERVNAGREAVDKYRIVYHQFKLGSIDYELRLFEIPKTVGDLTGYKEKIISEKIKRDIGHSLAVAGLAINGDWVGFSDVFKYYLTSQMKSDLYLYHIPTEETFFLGEKLNYSVLYMSENYICWPDYRFWEKETEGNTETGIDEYWWYVCMELDYSNLQKYKVTKKD
ncbi:MAG: hypothetical protein Kow0090_20680 [Myxococcota bacterium]